MHRQSTQRRTSRPGSKPYWQLVVLAGGGVCLPRGPDPPRCPIATGGGVCVPRGPDPPRCPIATGGGVYVPRGPDPPGADRLGAQRARVLWLAGFVHSLQARLYASRHSFCMPELKFVFYANEASMAGLWGHSWCPW